MYSRLCLRKVYISHSLYLTKEDVKKERKCMQCWWIFNIISGVKFKSTVKVMGPPVTWKYLEHHLKAAQPKNLNFVCLIDQIPSCSKIGIYMTGDKKRQEDYLLILYPLWLSKVEQRVLWTSTAAFTACQSQPFASFYPKYFFICLCSVMNLIITTSLHL